MITKVKTESKENKYHFIKGDYVFELETPLDFTKEHIEYFIKFNDWEVCYNPLIKKVEAVALHHKKYSQCQYIMDNFTKKFNNKIRKQYQLA